MVGGFSLLVAEHPAGQERRATGQLRVALHDPLQRRAEEQIEVRLASFGLNLDLLRISGPHIEGGPPPVMQIQPVSGRTHIKRDVFVAVVVLAGESVVVPQIQFLAALVQRAALVPEAIDMLAWGQTETRMGRWRLKIDAVVVQKRVMVVVVNSERQRIAGKL